MTKQYRQYPRMTRLEGQYPHDVPPLRMAFFTLLKVLCAFFIGYGILAFWSVMFGVCTCR